MARSERFASIRETAAGVVRKITPERWRTPEVVAPQEKPIVVLNLPHGDNSIGTIEMFQSAIYRGIEHLWDTRSKGRVAVVVEHASGTRELSQMVKDITANPSVTFSPSEAMQAAMLLQELLGKEPEVPEGLGKFKGFIGMRNRVLDHIDEQHPGTIMVVPEGHDPEVVMLVTDPRLAESFNTVYAPFPEDPDQAFYDKYIESLGLIAQQQVARDNSDTRAIAEIVEDENVAYVVKMHGSSHKSGVLLEQQGYNVHNYYENGETEYIEPPISALISHCITDPDTPLTADDVRLAHEAYFSDVEIPEGATSNEFNQILRNWIAEQKAALQKHQAEAPDASVVEDEQTVVSLTIEEPHVPAVSTESDVVLENVVSSDGDAPIEDTDTKIYNNYFTDDTSVVAPDQPKDIFLQYGIDDPLPATPQSVASQQPLEMEE